MPLASSTDTTNGNTTGFTMSPRMTAPPPPGKTASQMLQERAENFFIVLGRQAYGMKNQAEWKDRFARACPYDHLRYGMQVTATFWTVLFCVKGSQKAYMSTNNNLS